MRVVQILVAGMLVLGLVSGVHAKEAALEAGEVARRAEVSYPGSDQRSKLTFIIKDPEGERKIVLRRFWKNYDGAGNLAWKLLVFYEYPPENRGAAFMHWSYSRDSGKPDDRWLYIPILRKVQKVPENAEDDGFEAIDFSLTDMSPRPTALDSHELLDEEMVGQRAYYLVKSVPKRPDPGYPYSQVVKWVSKDGFLKERADYYDLGGELLKQQFITWKQVGDAWVWEKVVMKNARTGLQTVLSISEIQVNSGLADTIFTERVMARGLAALAP